HSLLSHSFCLFFSFLLYGYHRDLHSFPTRRSSDLCSDCPMNHIRIIAFQKLCEIYNHFFRVINQLVIINMKKWYVDILRMPCCRSEEHTSELQSRENLVCRLLLEKKKKNKIYTITT